MKTNGSISPERKIYDLEQMLEISKSFSSALDFSTLTESIMYSCMAQMKVVGAGVFIMKNLDSLIFELDDTVRGLEIDNTIKYKISKDNPIPIFLQNFAKPITLEELLENISPTIDLTPITSLSPTLIVPLIFKNEINGILLLGERIDLGEDTSYSEYEREHINSIASLAAISINNALLLEMSTTDMMTKLKLKHYFFSILDSKIESSFSCELPISVAMFDIDHFKIFNDTYGHTCGDYVLEHVAQIIKDGTRVNDVACRYGGEEFVLLLYNTDEELSFVVADRIRKSIEKTLFTFNDKEFNVKISGGVSTLLPDGKKLRAKEFIDRADKALYHSKNSGRNKISTFSNTKD